jgi:hypothetical protein
MMTMRDRYLNDPAFHALVDVLYAHVEQGQFTPTEIREAAMLAQIKYEERHLRPIQFTADQVRKGLV